MKETQLLGPAQPARAYSVRRLLPLAALFIAPAIVMAAPITGNLALSGHTTEVIAVNGTFIDFDFTGSVSGTPPIATSGTVDGSGSGQFDVGAASTGSFSALAGTVVNVHDLSLIQQPVGTFVGPGLPLTNFITFAAQPTWSISLTELLPGSFGTGGCGGAPAVGQTCTPTGSPFNLSNLTGNQVQVSFTFLGNANDGLGNITNVSGTFGATFSNTNLQAILAALSAGNAVVSTGSGTVFAASGVPEPGSISMMLLGSMLITSSVLYRRRQQR